MLLRATHRRATRSALAAAIVGTLGLLAAGPAPAAAAVEPDLVAANVTVDRTTVPEGGQLGISHVARNTGHAKAAASTTRFYLSTDPEASRAARAASRTNPRTAVQDLRLTGEQPVKALAPGKAQPAVSLMVTVPVGTAAGTYSVLACTDDRGVVKEDGEANNCAVADKKVTVVPPKGVGSLIHRTFADTARWPETEDDAVEMLETYCLFPDNPVKAMSLKAALAGVDSFLREKAGDDALALLDESGLITTPESAQELAVSAVAQGSPGLALAALLEAHRLEPAIGTHLVNAAAMAASVGLPNEAIALLDAAQLKTSRTPAMGVSQRAISLAIRGQALLMTGRDREAAQMYKAALAAEPLLTEAAAGLAFVAACKGAASAPTFVRASRQRGASATRPDPEIDLGLGEATPLRQLPIAETAEAGVFMADVYEELNAGLLAELQARNAERQQLEDQLSEDDPDLEPAEIERRDSLLSMVYGVPMDSDVQAIRQQLEAQATLLQQHQDEFWGPGGTYLTLIDEAQQTCEDSEDSDCFEIEMKETCTPALSVAHLEWARMIADLQSYANQEMALVSKRMSAWASNLGSIPAHQIAMLAVAEEEHALYGRLVGTAYGWTVLVAAQDSWCVNPATPEPVEDDEADDPSSAGPCPPELQAISAVVLLGEFGKVKVNCEKVQVELSKDVAAVLGAFVEVTYDFRSGNTTIFAGAKVEGKIENVVEGGFKSGGYLTFNGSGGITDVGMRAGPSLSVGGAPAEFQVHEDMVDFSFVGRVQNGT